MTETEKGFVQLHTSVLLAGFTGLFGRLITLNEVDIVWYRMLFTTSILLVFTGLPKVGRRKFLQLCGCGALLGIHWILFYGSIKASNVSIGVICFSLIGFFTAIFEPLIVVCGLCILRHLQQESQCGGEEQDGAHVSDDWRIGSSDDDSTVLSTDVPYRTTSIGHP